MAAAGPWDANVETLVRSSGNPKPQEVKGCGRNAGCTCQDVTDDDDKYYLYYDDDDYYYCYCYCYCYYDDDYYYYHYHYHDRVQTA